MNDPKIAPAFAVVGHVNRGKSSIVSTLAADANVAIDDRPGTTRRCQRFPARLGGETLYTLIDTPGFERARQALAWLKEGAGDTRDRAARVAAFLETHAGTDAFPEECELLRPILSGAAILYVVDGSLPFRPTAEAETEILQWTGRPRMALINPIAGNAYAEEWRRVLDQYFSLVRVFDAHQADFPARLELLRALRELDPAWRAPLDHAIERLEDDHEARRSEAAGVIADAIVDLLTHTDEQRLAAEAPVEPEHGPLEERYYAWLRERELRMRQSLRGIYALSDLPVEQAQVDRVDADLFDTSTWSRLGLSRRQLASAGAAGGAVVGGTVDAALGGASFLLGAAIGGAVGAASSWWAFDRLARVAVLGAPLGGTRLLIGPMPHPNFPWVVLDRALIFHDAVSRHAHASRNPIDLTGREGRASALAAELRRPIQAGFDRLRRNPDPGTGARLRAELVAAIEAVL